MRKQMQNKNEYLEDGHLTIQKIKRCFIERKLENIFYFVCEIHQRGVNFYRYQSGWDYLQKSVGEKKLWLSEDAKNTLMEKISAFEKELSEKKNYQKLELSDEDLTLFCRPSGDRYDFILEFVTENSGESAVEMTHDKTLIDVIKILRYFSNMKETENYKMMAYPTKDNLSKNPFLRLAREYGGPCDEIRLKMFYHLESKEDCENLSAIIGKPILPPLSQEYDKKYVIDRSTMDEEDELLLFLSGYEIRHRPYFAMPGYTHKRMTINPCTKMASDAGKECVETISFDEFLDLFGNWALENKKKERKMKNKEEEFEIYKYIGFSTDFRFCEPRTNREYYQEINREIFKSTDAFNSKNKGNGYAFVSQIDKNTFTIGIICPKGEPPEILVQKYCDAIGVSLISPIVEKIDDRDFSFLLEEAKENGTSNDYSLLYSILKRFHFPSRDPKCELVHCDFCRKWVWGYRNESCIVLPENFNGNVSVSCDNCFREIVKPKEEEHFQRQAEVEEY